MKLPIEILCEVGNHLELKYQINLRQTCKRLYRAISSRPNLSFPAFKREVLLATPAHLYSLKLNKTVPIDMLLFFVKYKCTRQFKQYYNPSKTPQKVKEIMLEYVAEKCSLQKSQLAFYLLCALKDIDAVKGGLLFVCRPVLLQAGHLQDEDVVNFESQLVVDLKDWNFDLHAFRQW